MKAYNYRNRFIQHRQYLMSLCFCPSKQLVLNSSPKELACVILYIKLLMTGVIGLNSVIFKKLSKRKQYKQLLSIYSEGELGDKNKHKEIVIGILPIAKLLLDPLVW